MQITLLGSTGSIGKSALDVVRQNSGTMQVFALAAGRNVKLLAFQIREFQPQLAIVDSPETLDELHEELRLSGLARSAWPELDWGTEAQVRAATAPGVGFVLSAIVGVAGLSATYAAVSQGKRVGLANKEVLVAAGELVMRAAREAGTELLPVDSEHNGAHQCFRCGHRDEVRRLYLTASGGPFRKTPASQLWNVTPEQALNHPTWKMGARITIDSATMMNKGFEVVEACWLFDLLPEQVSVLVHPQSAVHAMVEYQDGSLMLQVSPTDMRLPIQYALTYPHRTAAPVSPLSWEEARIWEFEAPDFEKFRALKLAYQSAKAGGMAPCVLNAADEIAVAAFLDGRIPFGAIPEIVEETLTRQTPRHAATIEEVLAVDAAARETAAAVVEEARWESRTF